MSLMKQTVLIGLLIAVPFSHGASLSFGDAPFQTQQYDVKVPGMVEIRLEVSTSSFTLGEPILVTKVLTNIGATDLTVIVDAMEEGFWIEDVFHPNSCGVIGDHAPGYKAATMVMPLRTATSSTADMSKNVCFKGHGLYRIGGGYCHHVPGRVHGQDPPDWCVRAKPLVVRVK